ncbi:NUDIX domain-containing protein [Paracoccus caeni]|uniref:NUDIX domain-containing protein n=1 Tax=Paracoccus caeni TaxID=657651 RepID=A0A934SE43_9RHOB|nr:NUDIX domain-containing protein [Paracoccus caeni]MBK4215694.1 NUDIX domain-containing protein [Paracoccus caeni]
MQDIYLVGLLAQRLMLAAFGLTGAQVEVKGRLLGGERAGIERDGWPVLKDEDGAINAVRVQSNDALQRYIAVMGLQPLSRPEGPVFGAVGQGEAVRPWHPVLTDLAAEIATLIVEAPADQDVKLLSRRLPMLGVLAASRLRGRASAPSGGEVVAPHGSEDLRVVAKRQPYAGFFAVEAWDLAHRKHDGGFTPVITREALVSGDAVIVLPWDPVRDRVMVIEQFRLIPALRHDPQPWLLEPIAGRVDAGESVEDAIRREALEEADLNLGRLYPAVNYYPSPGTLGEFLYTFAAIADLPDGITGVHGLDGEAEDIRGHVLPRETLVRMVTGGQVTNGPLAMIVLWLETQKDRIRAELAQASG